MSVALQRSVLRSLLLPECKYAIAVVHYSRRNKSLPETPYKYVKSKVKVGDEGSSSLEGKPNWELFSSKGNRFYLPNGLGPAWVSKSTVTPCETLQQLVDWENNDETKLWIAAQICPVLTKKNMLKLFPLSNLVKSEPFTLLSLRYHGDSEEGAKKFVLASREICSRLKDEGYFGDFLNPFSGKPFFSYNSGMRLLDSHERLNEMKFETFNKCVVISSDITSTKPIGFEGFIFTNVSPHIKQIQELLA